MKKLVLIIIVIASSLLFAEDDMLKEFNKYQENPTYENFITASNYFEGILKEDATNSQARLFVIYLHEMRMNSNMEYLSNNIENIDMKTKFQYANLLLELGQFENSIEIYNVLNENVPKWSCPWRHKGEAYYKSGDMTGAEVAFLKAIETRKEHYDAYVWLAKAQKELGKYKEALASLETGLSYKGKDIEDSEEEVATSEVDALHKELKELAK